ncbi:MULTISPECIES: nuclear transport factor 2 family protein [Amycolatopsis]|uniref:Nuclear transport factor 2 family protein n=1 Tax=Amycolatopsis albidoflavus TaxID=102226 RepID=A0ABW5HZ07_9PSEU
MAGLVIPVEEWAALHDLVHRYAARVDERDFAGVARLFGEPGDPGEPGVLVLPDPPREFGPVHEHRGPEAVAAALSVLDEVPLTAHGITGAVFDPGDDPATARGRITCVAHHVTRRDGRFADAVWHLRYLDRYAKIGGEWRFARREVHLDLIGTREVRASRLGR